MKKSIVALSALTVAGLASAQSSVRLFGALDAGVSYYDAKTTNLTTGASTKQSSWRQSSSGYNSSRLGFLGTEDLGGGLAAGFWLEMGLNNDTGDAGQAAGVGSGGSTAGVPNTGPALFNRRSTVSLSGPLGEVRLGRDYTPSFWNDTVFDPFGTNGVGTNLLTSAHTGDLNSIRTSNSVGYFLPADLGGFYGQFQYGISENVKTTGVASSDAGRGVAGRLGYTNGPVNLALAYGQSTVLDIPAISQSKVTTANLGAHYDFGIIKAFVQLSQIKYTTDFNTPQAGTELKRNGYLIGLTAPVGPGVIRASYTVAKDSLSGVPDPEASKLSIGYVHNLSKRTALYATASRINNKNGQRINFGGSGTAFLTTTPGNVQSAGVANGYDMGIRHAF